MFDCLIWCGNRKQMSSPTKHCAQSLPKQPRSYSYFHIFPSMQGASEMHIKQTDDYLPSHLPLAGVHWGKHCRHPSELCSFLFSMSHYMKYKEHDYKCPEPRDSPAIFSKQMNIDKNGFDDSSGGYKLRDSHLELCLSLPRLCLQHWERSACEASELRALWLSQKVCTLGTCFKNEMAHNVSPQVISVRRLPWPFQKWFIFFYLFIQLFVYWFSLMTEVTNALPISDHLCITEKHKGRAKNSA